MTHTSRNFAPVGAAGFAVPLLVVGRTQGDASLR